MRAFQDRLDGIALGAVVGDDLGMLREFLSLRIFPDLETEIVDGTLPAGASPRLDVVVC